jgi:hypothetical protein
VERTSSYRVSKDSSIPAIPLSHFKSRKTCSHNHLRRKNRPSFFPYNRGDPQYEIVKGMFE